MNIQTLRYLLAITTFLTGLYGGTGFFILMGGNPAMYGLSTSNFAEYWQLTDHYMAARMPVFGSILLLSFIASLIVLARQYKSASFRFLVLAVLIVIADIIFVASVNRPLNTMIQSWNLNSLPADVRAVQLEVYHAFQIRSWFMIAIFAFTLMAQVKSSALIRR